MTYADPGMTVFEDYPFLAATPDLEITELVMAWVWLK